MASVGPSVRYAAGVEVGQSLGAPGIRGPVAALADLHRQRVCGHGHVVVGVQWPAITETRDFDDLVMPRVSMSLIIRQLETPNRYAGRDHRAQRPLGPLASRKQPVEGVGALRGMFSTSSLR